MTTAQLSLADTVPPMKQCKCGLAYDAAGWAALQLAGRMTDGADGELELRHCACGSTIAIEVPKVPAPPAAASDPHSNSPADLGWNAQSTTPKPSSARARPEQFFKIPHGTPRRSCTSCGGIIYFVPTTKGKQMPVDPDGRTHFATCPDAAAHRRRSSS